MGEIWSEKVRCSTEMKARLRSEWVVLSEELCILSSCFLSPMSKNSVFWRSWELGDWQSSGKRFAKKHVVGVNVWVKVGRVKWEKQLCVVCIKVLAQGKGRNESTWGIVHDEKQRTENGALGQTPQKGYTRMRKCYYIWHGSSEMIGLKPADDTESTWDASE